MKFRLLVAGLVLAALLAGGYYIDRARAANENVLSGFFENQPTQCSSRIGGRVAHILVKEGDRVKAGQPMVELDAVPFERSVQANVQAERQAAEQYKETARGPRSEDIDKQAAVVQEADWDYRKLVNGPLPEEIRAAGDKLRSAQAAYQKALAGSRPQEIEAARATDRLAFDKLREAENGLTQEERGQLRARLQEAEADEVLKRRQLDRERDLYNADAISANDYDIALSTWQQSEGRRLDAADALRRAEAGTRPEEIAQARESYRQAHAQLTLLLAGTRPEDIAAARAEMRNAEENLRLLERGSRVEDIRAAKARLDQARQSLLELERGNRTEEIARTKAAQRQAKRTAESAEANLRDRTIFAPIDAQVDRVQVADGDLIAANAPVIQLSDPANVWIRVYLPENQLARVKPGDAATLAVDGVAGTVAALVESIDTVGQFTPANLQSEDERGLQVFGIRLRLAHPDPRIKAGMYGSVKQVGQWPK